MIDIANIPLPDIVQEKTFEDIKQENTDIIKGIDPDLQVLESDVAMLLSEAFAYKELAVRTKVNEMFLALFLGHSKGNDLDNLGITLFGVERLNGEKPSANYTFKLVQTFDSDTTIPKNLFLTDGKGNFASPADDIVIEAGALEKTVIVLFDAYVVATPVKTEMIATPLPFVISAKAKEAFTKGAVAETDEDYTKRLLLSLDRFSTAGSKASYEYHAMSCDTRIVQVVALSDVPCVVDVIYYSKDADDLMQQRLETALNAEKVRPLTDQVNINCAQVLSVDINLVVHLLAMEQRDIVDSAIKTAFDCFMPQIGENLPHSAIVKRAFVPGVFKIEATPDDDIDCDERQIIEINDLNISYVQAVI